MTDELNEVKKLIGKIGVDSGLVWIGDPCYMRDDGSEKLDYDQICETIGGKSHHSFNYKMGHEGLGVCTHNPIGDGTYPVYGVFKNGEYAPSQIIIDFEGLHTDD